MHKRLSFFSIYKIIHPSVIDLLKNHNLTYRLRNDPNLEPELIEEVFDDTQKYAHVVEDIKYKVDNETYVDDGRVYVRWINDVLRFGMFAGREFNKGDVLGLYVGNSFFFL